MQNEISQKKLKIFIKFFSLLFLVVLLDSLATYSILHISNPARNKLLEMVYFSSGAGHIRENIYLLQSSVR